MGRLRGLSAFVGHDKSELSYNFVMLLCCCITVVHQFLRTVLLGVSDNPTVKTFP